MPETISRVTKVCQLAKKSVWALFEQGARTAVSCSYSYIELLMQEGYTVKKKELLQC